MKNSAAKKKKKNNIWRDVQASGKEMIKNVVKMLVVKVSIQNTSLAFCDLQCLQLFPAAVKF